MSEPTVFDLGAWSNLDPITATKIYLFGQMEAPAYRERVRGTDAPEVIVKIDAASFMAPGAPGGYALPSNAPAVQKFFSADTMLPDGTYSIADLKVLGWSDDDFNFPVSQYLTDINSQDYMLRSYIFGSTNFQIVDATFVVTNGEKTIAQLQLAPSIDNFDYESSSSLQLLQMNLCLNRLLIHIK